MSLAEERRNKRNWFARHFLLYVWASSRIACRSERKEGGMKQRVFLFGVALVFVTVGFVQSVSAQDKAKKIVRWSTADLQWSPVPGAPVMESKAWSAANGSNCGFNKFPKGSKVPLHSHTADLSAIVVAGQFGSMEEGAPVKLSGSGTYQFIPGGLKHTTECGPEADCVVFRCQPGAFDLVEAGPKK